MSQSGRFALKILMRDRAEFLGAYDTASEALDKAEFTKGWWPTRQLVVIDTHTHQVLWEREH